ncbi:MAG: hypothetical protein AB1Z23_10720 [Eubacteriales bacterium]
MKNKKRQNSLIWAIVLIITGIIIILSSFDFVNFDGNFYFLIAIAVVGVIFHISCFMSKPKKYNYLVPGGMLLAFSALFITIELSDTITINDVWPLLILAVAFGMLEQKVFSRGEQGTWSSIAVVTIVGLFFLIKNNLGFGIAFGTLLVLLGIAIIWRMFKKISKDEEKAEKEKKEADEFDQE